MFKKIMLFTGLTFVLAGCGNQENTSGMDETVGTDAGTTETSVATDKPDFQKMSKEEIATFFEGMTVEEIQELTTQMQPAELVDQDGNPVEFPEEAYQNTFDAGRESDFHSKDLGSGVNPAGIGEKVTREVEIYDVFGELGEQAPKTQPGVFEITMLRVTTGEEAWDILSSIDFNSMVASEPTDFDYVIAEFEMTLVDGPDYGMMIPSVSGTVDEKGNKLFDLELLPITNESFMNAVIGEEGNKEGTLIHKGETLTGDLVGKLPKEGKASLELIYNGVNYLFFEPR